MKPKKQPGSKRKLYLIISGVVVLILVGLFLNRPTLREKLVRQDWYLFDDTTVSLKMNDNTVTKKDRLFDENGKGKSKSLAQVVFKPNGTGTIKQASKTIRFKWTLNKNVITLKQRQQHKIVTIHWTLATTSGKVAGQRFKGYTVDSDDVTTQLFVGKGFLIHKR